MILKVYSNLKVSVIGVQHSLSDMYFLKESNTEDIVMLWLLIVTQHPWVIMSNA